MSDTAQCPNCGATCRVVGQAEGSPRLQAFQNTDAEHKIAQLKKSLQQVREALQSERAATKALTADLEQFKDTVGYSNPR